MVVSLLLCQPVFAHPGVNAGGEEASPSGGPFKRMLKESGIYLILVVVRNVPLPVVSVGGVPEGNWLRVEGDSGVRWLLLDHVLKVEDDICRRGSRRESRK